MGCNYYARINPCPTCGHSREKLHIGKSSWGWAFTLHVIPEEGINTLEDWERILSGENVGIYDEYGDNVSLADLLDTIKDRDKKWPTGARRHDIDGIHCIGHGEGSWDYIKGEFS